MHRRTHLGELGVVVGLAGLLAWLFRPEPVGVEVVELSRGRIATTVSAEGRVRVKDLYTVSAPLGGRLQRITLKPGDAVLAGEAVALLTPALPGCLDGRDQAVTTAAVDAAQAAAQATAAALAAARAGESFATTELNRIRALAGAGFASPAALDLATTSLAARRAETAAAAAAGRSAQHRAERLRARLIQADPAGPAQAALAPAQAALAVTAPASGRVLQVVQDSETVVTPGQPLLTLGDPSDLEVVVPLPSEQVVGLSPGLPVRLERWGGPALPGRVARIEPAGHTVLSLLGFEDQRVAVIVDITAPPAAHGGLGHGYRIDVTIEREAHDGLRLPVGALVRHDGAWTVFAVEDGTARRRSLAELEPGAMVVVYPGERVADGVKVRLR